MSGPFDHLSEDLKGSLQSVRGLIESLVQDSPLMIRRDLEVLTARPGKMLRPLFLFLSARGGEAEYSSLVSVAAAFELLHIASLAHDDVLDNAARRRGELTLHTLKGAKRAVLAGDYLLAMALRLASSHFQDSMVSRLTSGLERLCMSEIAQDEALGQFAVSRDEYYSRIQGKTAELFALSCLAGSVLAGKDEEKQKQAYQTGLDFGMAFQIQDDLLDYLGDARIMGKQGNSDLKNGIPTLPLILSLEEKPEAYRLSLKPWLLPFTAARVSRRIIREGYHEKANAIAADFMTRSLEGAALCMDADSRRQYGLLVKGLEKRYS